MLMKHQKTSADESLETSHIVQEAKVETKLPGDKAMWFLILMELTVFAILFIGFAVTQRLNMAMFVEGRATLSTPIGLYCTLSLVLSSYFVALSVESVRRGNNLLAKRHLILSVAVACVYLVLKLWEYATLGELGFGLTTNSFYTLYFFITGFHFMHVLLGVGILIFMAARANKNYYSVENCHGFEAGGSYWHMIDLVWVIVFFLIYIIH